MRDFNCPNCGQRLAFENSLCLSCGSSLGFSLADMALLVIAPGEESEHAGAVDSSHYQLCANLYLAQCNWLVEMAPTRRLCTSCALTRTRPNEPTPRRWRRSPTPEKAKRRLIAELYELKLPIVGRDEDPDYGLAFDLLSSEFEQVFTGHENGVITLDLAEGDDVHREQLRVAMDEPYRTLLGHFRHEIGHYYFYRLVDHVAGVLGSGSASCSATPMPTTRPRWTGTTTTAHRRTGKSATSRPMPPCIPPRTGPRRSPTICTSATRWTPLPRSASLPRGDVRAKSAGPKRVRHDHRHVVAVGVGAEHDQPLDG